MSRIYDGASASLEILTPDLGAQYEIEDQPLRGISYDKTGIELHFATRDGKHLVHRIDDPKQVLIEESDDGLLAAVDIESSDNLRTIVHFSAPKASRLLTGH